MGYDMISQWSWKKSESMSVSAQRLTKLFEIKNI